jgi:altronate dehydratase small subunit
MTIKAIVVDPQDSVATALADLAEGEILMLETGPIELRTPVAFGHKLALARIEAGEPVTKYGEVIGRATRAIAPGEHVHLHNLESMRGRGDLR